MSEQSDKKGDFSEQVSTDDASESEILAVADQGEESGEELEEHVEIEEFKDASSDELIDLLLAARLEINAMKNGYVRAKADVENIQRRSHNEIVSARKYAIEGFASELLSVIDSLDQAARVELDESSSEALVKMKEGLELTLKQFDKVMEKFGITCIEAAQGIRFDPELHQAISMVASDEVEADHIVDVMQKGFMLKDRLLRPAMVVIAN